MNILKLICIGTLAVVSIPVAANAMLPIDVMPVSKAPLARELATRDAVCS